MAAESPIRIVFFAHNFPPINTSGVQRAQRFWKYLPASGVTAHVVCSSVEGALDLPNVSYAPAAATQTPRTRAESILARGIQRVIPHNERLEWIPHALEAAEQVHRRTPFHGVLSTFPSLCAHLAALLFVRRHPNLPWIADFRDNLVGNPFRRRKGGIDHETPSERWIFRRADLITSVTDGLTKEWAERHPAQTGKFRVIFNGFDPEEEFPQFPIANRGRRILAHLGTIYGQRHPHQLLSSLERLIEAGRLDPASVKVELTGPLREAPGVRPIGSFAALHRHGALEVTNDMVPRAESLRRMAEADYLLLMDINELNVGHTVPAKLFEYICARRPIFSIASRDSIVERILVNAGIPHTSLYPEDDETRTDEKVLDFFSRPPAPFEPTAWYSENFDGRRQAATLAQLFRELIARR